VGRAPVVDRLEALALVLCEREVSEAGTMRASVISTIALGCPFSSSTT
jgi:hypothetical protein